MEVRSVKQDAWITWVVVGCLLGVGCGDGADGVNGADGQDGVDGMPGAMGTPGVRGAPGTAGEQGPAGAAGSNGTSCTVVDNLDGTVTISCENGTTATVSDGAAAAAGEDGEDGTSCTVTDNGDGTVTISCEDGTTATVHDGQDGTNGDDGENGKDGKDGSQGPSLGTTTPAFTSAAGGTGGDPYTLSCPEGTIAMGVGGTWAVPDQQAGTKVLEALYLRCRPWIGAATSTDATSPLTHTAFGPIECPAGSVMTGVTGTTVSTGGALVVQNLTLQCTPLFSNTPATTATVHNDSSGAPFALTCPAGKVVTGFDGKRGANIDSLRVRCQ